MKEENRMIYEIKIEECESLAIERWFIKQISLLHAVQKAEQKMKSSKEFRGWKITAAKEVGDLVE